MSMKSVINLTGDSELPAEVLDEIDVMEVIEPAFTLRFDRADEPGFADVLVALLADFPNAANAVVVLPAGVPPDSAAVKVIQDLLPDAPIIIL